MYAINVFLLPVDNNILLVLFLFQQSSEIVGAIVESHLGLLHEVNSILMRLKNELKAVLTVHRIN